MAQIHDMNTNINAAHAAGVQVILTSDHFPKWLSDPTSNTEPSITAPNAIFPADRALMLPTAKTPFQRTDFQYYQWVLFLMLMYHPGNPNRLALAEGASIDAFELVNEPNLVLKVSGQGPNSTLAAHKTALMMTTARSVVDHYNRLWGKQGTLALLGPATAGSGNWQGFTRQLISDLTNGGKTPVRDRNFGWSHHNYHDVENIGNGIASLDQQLNTFGPITSPPLFNRDAVYRSIARYLYGSGTQQLRGILDPPSPGFPDLPGLPHTELWYGAGSSGDPDPKVWLTEGGCRLDQMPHFSDPPPVGAGGDPNALYDTNGNLTSVPAAFQRQLQLYAVGGGRPSSAARYRRTRR
ncbi:MAG: hypothetical protein M3065_02420 [Actinomycetota bacterium]|nr:hypothetical protein [Actinomycetota bacterium]